MTEGGTFKWIIINCVMGPTVNHLTSHYLTSSPQGVGRDENTFSGFKSALNRCPYAEPFPHYSGRSGRQHLYAVVMKTAQRPSEKATLKWEERKHSRSVWEGRSALWANKKSKVMMRRSVQEIKNASASEIREYFGRSFAWKVSMSKLS